MVECPRCKSEDVELVKSWEVRPKSKRGKAIKVSIYLCHSCGNKFRKAVKLEEEEAIQPVAASIPVQAESSNPQTIADDEPKESFLDKLKKSFHLF